MDGRRRVGEVVKQIKRTKKTMLFLKKDIPLGAGVVVEKAKMMKQQNTFMHLCEILHMYLCQAVNTGYN